MRTFLLSAVAASLAFAALPADAHGGKPLCRCAGEVVTPPAEAHAGRVQLRAAVDDGIHPEEEDRRGLDDREYGYRSGGLHLDVGDGRGSVYREARDRVWAPGEHWIAQCGCGPDGAASPDADSQLAWRGKLAPDGYADGPLGEVRP